jgi:hypothetical protein
MSMNLQKLNLAIVTVFKVAELTNKEVPIYT